MKLSSPGGDSDILGMPVESLWNTADITNSEMRHFLIGEDTKLALGSETDEDDESNLDHKSTSASLDDLDLLFTATSAAGSTIQHSNSSIGNNTLAELKPLPPFHGYTGNLSINGIPGHHYHAIATAPNSSRILIETNNNSVETANQNNVPSYYTSTEQVVSSSTIDSGMDSIKTEPMIDLVAGMDEDIAAIIGSAIVDTTVPNRNGNGVDGDDSRDSWLDLDAWIGSACGAAQSNSPPLAIPISSLGPPPGVPISSLKPNGNNNCNNMAAAMTSNVLPNFVNSQFSMSNSAAATGPPQSGSLQLHNIHHLPHHHIKLQSMVSSHSQHIQQQQQQQQQQADMNNTFSHMPLLQSRLENGPPKPLVDRSSVQAATAAGAEITYVTGCSSPTSSTPFVGSAHSPPCHVVSTSDIGFIPVHSSTRPSPELQVSFPHTTTPSKKSRSRNKAKSMSTSSSTSIVYNDGTNIGKEKTVHRCNICNRGFLNKSNIKVHLRTHTGEKPFRCEICSKAFRQKAHLIKHAQIHKRIGRD